MWFRVYGFRVHSFRGVRFRVPGFRGEGSGFLRVWGSGGVSVHGFNDSGFKVPFFRHLVAPKCCSCRSTNREQFPNPWEVLIWGNLLLKLKTLHGSKDVIPVESRYSGMLGSCNHAGFLNIGTIESVLGRFCCLFLACKSKARKLLHNIPTVEAAVPYCLHDLV